MGRASDSGNPNKPQPTEKRARSIVRQVEKNKGRDNAHSEREQELKRESEKEQTHTLLQEAQSNRPYATG